MEARFEFTLDPNKQVERLKAGMRNKVIRIAINKAASLVKTQVIDNAPNRTGTLKKSVKIKVKNYKNKNIWLAIVGASSKFKRKRKGKDVFPVRYALLVEKGTMWNKAQPYLKPALEQKRQEYIDTMTAKIREQVEQILSSANR
jgi:HK97 gp10 family phage protein